MAGELTVIEGEEFTLTVATAVFEHPLAVPVTVYEVEPAGDTVKGLFVDPVDHK
jgi:hypothetical protein